MAPQHWLPATLLVASAGLLKIVPVEYILPKLTLDPEELNSDHQTSATPPVVPADVPAHLIARCLDEGRRFPLVVSPVNDSQPIEDMVTWMRDNRATVERWMRDYGAVLLRGFNVSEATQFESVARAYSERLSDVYLGTSPRKPVGDSRYVFTASEFEAWKVVPSHCEMSFLHGPPETLFFFAAGIRQDMWGGESPLVDMRAVARDMDPRVRSSFEKKGIRYIRQYPSAASSHPVDTWDYFKTKTWQDMFRHVPNVDSNISGVEEECRRQGFTPSWGKRNILKLTHEMPAFRKHPTTGEMVWHNHLSVLHSASWADEFAFAGAHLRSPKYALLSAAFYALDGFMHLVLGRESLGQHVAHSSGEPIPAADVWHVRRLLWKHTLVAPWRQGDLILLDNFRLAHARMPFDAGMRNLWAIWTKEPEAMKEV